MSRRRMSLISRAKRAIARKTGIPTTRSGRTRKAQRIFGHAATGGNRRSPAARSGCLTLILAVCLAVAFITAIALAF
ncbi:MAG: hypothetical protein IJJ45_03935 [Clostridia bacterium]|nr:hypothetical protein [Clostridia bacterium]